MIRMSNLPAMDLPHYLSNQPRGAYGVDLVGVLIGEVEPPEPFKTMGLATKFDAFVALDLVGIRARSGDYYVRGQVLSVLPRSLVEAAKKKQSGRMALVLTGEAIKLSNVKDGVTNFVSMMKWVKGPHNSWQFRSVNAQPIIRDEYPHFFEVIVNAYKNGWKFTYPTTFPDSYTDACEGHVFKLVGGNTQEGAINPPGWGLGNGAGANGATSPSTIVSPDALSGASSNLGASSTSNISELIHNRTVTNSEIRSRNRSKIDNRDKLAPRSKNADLVEEFIKTSDEKVAEMVKDLAKYEQGTGVIDDALKYTAEALKRSWDRKVGASTGRMLFKRAVEAILPDFDTRSPSGETIIGENIEILGPRICDEWLNISSEQSENKFLLDLNANKVKIYLKMVELILGIRDKLVDSFDVCVEQDIDIILLIQDNPYNLCFIDPRISVEDLDKLAMTYGVNPKDPEVKRIRNVAYMHNYMLDSSNWVVRENTAVKYSDLLRNVKSGYTFSKSAVNTLRMEGYIVSYEMLESLRYFIHDKVNFENFALPRDGWKQVGYKEVLENKDSPSSLIKDYIESGLGVLMRLDGVDWVSDYVFAKKEMFIYNRLRELCEYRPRVIDREKIKKTIENFEKMKAEELGIPDYKLEHRQAEAVYMIGNGNRVACLTGPAGSGKTTTAEAMVYGLEAFLGVDPESIYFCAPTGKAANRLKEVVRRKTRTINSLFGIGGEGVALKDPDNIRKRDDIKALIVDESSMPNINLMYELLLRIEDGTYIFFLGDKEQLPPIGFGKPFANMLTFLPTVVLNVTKRASDKSGITRNAKKIIYESDGVVEDLDDYPDFRIIDEKNPERVVDYIMRIVNYHLGKGPAEGFTPVQPTDSNGNLLFSNDLKPDDIQIITPVNGNVWGTVSLNNLTHDSFNPRQPLEPAVSWKRGKDDVLEFRLRDRVMHIRSNQTERTRLIHHGKSSFTLMKDKQGEPVRGINNGEVGKIIGFFGAKELDFDLCDSESDIKDLKSEFRGTENTLFVGVEFSDVDLDTLEPINFVILYRAEILNPNPNGVIDIISSDLKYLDLANALTVHKLQGSQARLCICVFLPVGGPRSEFISRNMIYTSPTRAQEAVYMIGDIRGSTSSVNRGRKIEQSEKRLSIVDQF